MRIYDGRKSFFQWDVNQRITSPNLSVGDEVHFHTPTFPSALVVKAYALGDLVVADVPNIMLQDVQIINAYKYVTEADGRSTRKKCTFSVQARAKPEDYVYTETELLNYKFLEERLCQLEEYGVSETKLDNAVNRYFTENPVSVDESDPTVAAWAKEPKKPTYTAKEVGALPEDTEIPPIKYIESLDFKSLDSLVTIRGLDSGTYILYGRFLPYEGAEEYLAFSSGMLASILRQNVVTYMQIFYPKNNAVQYFEITDNTFTRESAELSKMESTDNKATVLDEKSSDKEYPTARAVFTALEKKEDVAHKITELLEGVTDEEYPSAKAVYSALNEKESLANRVNEVSEFSTDEQYPTAKAVYSALGNAESYDHKTTKVDENSTHEQYPSAEAVYNAVKACGDAAAAATEALKELTEAADAKLASDFAATIKSDTVPRMNLLDELEENNKNIAFSDLYNRVYVHLSKGRGDHARYCLTEAPTPPVDPDGTYYEHGGGKYFGVANNKISYDAQDIEGLEQYYGVVMNAEAKKYATFAEDMIDGQYLSVYKTGGGGATISFSHKGETRKKCIFETEMYINMDEAVFSKPSDNWFLRFDFLDTSGASVWGNQYVRLCYSASKGLYFYGSTMPVPHKKWFSLRIESVGTKTAVICDGLLFAAYDTKAISSFGGVKFELRTKTYANNMIIALDNTCTHSNNESVTSEATLSSVVQRTKQGHVRVPAFVIGEEPTEDDINYRDTIAIPYAYAQSMRDESRAYVDSKVGGLDFSPYAKMKDLEPYAKREELTPYAKTADLTAYAKTSDLTGYAKKSDIPNVSGFATTAQLSALKLKDMLSVGAWSSWYALDAQSAALAIGHLYEVQIREYSTRWHTAVMVVNGYTNAGYCLRADGVALEESSSGDAAYLTLRKYNTTLSDSFYFRIRDLGAIE